ncbi:hypothetical protein A9Q94_17150 [Rhodobacterales bacterium 56_14_T64]|nr:hypothetical protein A9Q94_17150 [Rhodobacterales bacterium 56_14_T64]
MFPIPVTVPPPFQDNLNLSKPEITMLVTNIEITQYHYDSNCARHCANVALSLRDRTVSLFCQINLPREGDAASRRLGFVDEAERQLRRMPEFRSGRQELRLADHLMHD